LPHAPTVPPSGVKPVKIGPGEHYVTQHGHELIITVLGSCVSACIRDPLARVGGMNHFMLPESATGNWGGASANMRYGNFAMERLINDILMQGGRRAHLEIKVFGGAVMLANGAAVGHQNADFVEQYLYNENMPIAASHLRGHLARRIEYMPLTGKVKMLEIADNIVPIAHAEHSFQKSLRHKDEAGSIELFD
jgi:chemotaxis protein CheD